MADRCISGFHAIEEHLRGLLSQEGAGCGAGARLVYSRVGPRVRRLLALAQRAGVACLQKDREELDRLASSLPEGLGDHRGVLLCVEGGDSRPENYVDFSQWIRIEREASLVLVLDSVTDPHNVGAMLRSCEQFGVDLVVMPERRGLKDPLSNEVVGRASAGANAWIPVAMVPNLVRVAEQLKEAGFWVYGADSRGQPLGGVAFPGKTAIVMGSEGDGIGRLLERHCDAMVSIPTWGRLDSLNVSVATGIFLYEVRRQWPKG